MAVGCEGRKKRQRQEAAGRGAAMAPGSQKRRKQGDMVRGWLGNIKKGSHLTKKKPFRINTLKMRMSR
jgi:hypothetical protein